MGKRYIEFLTGVILLRRLASLPLQMQFNFCVTYEIMRNRLYWGETMAQRTGDLAEHGSARSLASGIYEL